MFCIYTLSLSLPLSLFCIHIIVLITVCTMNGNILNIFTWHP